MAKNDLTQGLLQTGDPLPKHAKPDAATLVPQPRAAPPTGKPVPDQKPQRDFKLPDKVTTTDIKVEGARRAASAEGDDKQRWPR